MAQMCQNCEFFTDQGVIAENIDKFNMAIIDGHVYNYLDTAATQLLWRQDIGPYRMISWVCHWFPECLGRAETVIMPPTYRHMTYVACPHIHAPPNRMFVEACKHRKQWQDLWLVANHEPSRRVERPSRSRRTSSLGGSSKTTARPKESSTPTPLNLKTTKNRVKATDKSHPCNEDASEDAAEAKSSFSIDALLKEPKAKKRRTGRKTSAVDSHPRVAIKQESISSTVVQTEELSGSSVVDSHPRVAIKQESISSTVVQTEKLSGSSAVDSHPRIAIKQEPISSTVVQTEELSVEKTKNRVKATDESSPCNEDAKEDETKNSFPIDSLPEESRAKKRTDNRTSAVDSNSPVVISQEPAISATGIQSEELSAVTSFSVTLPPPPSKREMADEDSTQHSQSSRSSTPNVSNPGTPRQELAQEVRATPPLAVPSTSTIQRTIPGQAQPPSIPPPPAAATAAAATAAATAAAMATPPQQQGVHPMSQLPQSKYSSLLAVIEDMGRDIRPTYAGNRTSSERLKRSIVHARILVRECLMECERSART